MANESDAPDTVKPMTKSEILNALSDRTGLPKKDVGAILDELTNLIGDQLAQGPQVFSLPGLVKIQAVRKPATPAGTRPDPFRPGQTMTVAAKPARNVIKVRPLKGLKDMV